MDEDEVLEEEERLPLTGGQVAGSAATEISAAIVGEVGAAFLKNRVPLGGLASRLFSGMAGSLVAQKGVEKRDELQLGRVIAAGAANSVVFRKKNLISPAKDAMIKGAGIAAGERLLGDTIDAVRGTGEVSLGDTLLAGATGGILGKSIGKIDEKYFSTATKLIGKSPKQIDDLIASGDKNVESEIKSVLRPILGRDATEQEVVKTKTRVYRERQAEAIANRETPFLSSLKNVLATAAPGASADGVKIPFINVRKALIGKGSKESYLKFEDEMRAAEAQSSKFQRRFDEFTLEERPDLKEDVLEFIQGGKMSDNLSKAGNITADLHKFRELEIEVATKLRDSFEEFGTFNYLPKTEADILKTRLNESIQRGYRMYDTKLYAGFVDQKFAPNASQKQQAIDEVNDALIRDRKIDPADEEAITAARKLATDHINRLEQMFAINNPSTTGRLVASLPGRLEAKIEGHAPGPKERAFLGEYKSAQLEAGLSAKFRLLEPRRHLAMIQSDQDLLTILRNNGFVSSQPLAGYMPLNLKHTQAADDLYVPIETVTAITRLYEGDYSNKVAEGFMGNIQDLFGGAVGLSKAVKVIFNVPSYSVNAIGGFVSMASNGMIPGYMGKNYKNFSPLRSWARGANLAASELDSNVQLLGKKVANYNALTKKSDAATRKLLLDDIEEMYKYGIGNASLAANAVADALKTGAVGNIVDKATRQAGKLYSITDTAARYATWKHNQEFVQKVLVRNKVKINPEKVKAIAAQITNDTYQNYNRTTKVGRALSRIGVLPQFITFTLEIMRNTTNAIRYAGMMRNGDSFAKYFDIELNDAARAALAAEGTRRFAFLGAVLAFTVGAMKSAEVSTGLFSAFTGKDEDLGSTLYGEELDDFRFFSPSYLRNQDIIASYDKETGMGAAAAVSYILPHATLTQLTGPGKDFVARTFNRYAQGDQEADIETAREFGELFSEQFLGEGTFVGRNIYGALANRDIRGQEITEKEGFDKFKDLLTYVAKESFTPGSFSDIKRFNQAGGFDKVLADAGIGEFTREVDPSNYTFQEILLRQVGLRFQRVDVKRMASQRIQDFSKRHSIARGRYTVAKKYRSGQLSESELNQMYQDSLEQSVLAYREVEEAYQRLDRMGFNSEEKIKIMRDGNVKSEDIFRVSRGLDFIPYSKEVSLTTGEQYTELAEGKTDREVKSVIKSMKRSKDAKEAIMGRRFEAERNRRSIDERRGRTPEDRLLLNMDLLSRARSLVEINAHRDRGLYREYRRKGIINNDVASILKGI